MSTVTYKIPNISCGHCVHTIQSEVSELPGVKSVVADRQLRPQQSHQPPATGDLIKTMLREINYPVAN
jgi:copper chaperone CopZ